jgi:hypothetical protein
MPAYLELGRIANTAERREYRNLDVDGIRLVGRVPSFVLSRRSPREESR